MARWEVVVEEQAALLEFWQSPAGADYALGFSQDVRDKGRDGAELYAASHAIETAKLERAQPVWVDAHILDLVDHARESFQPEAMLTTDAFIPEGFAFFERPVFVEDVNMKRAAFRAMSWGPIALVHSDGRSTGPEGQLHICLYSHWEDEDDYSGEMAEKFRLTAEARGVTARSLHREVWGSTRLSMFHVGMVPFGLSPEDVYRELTDEQRQLSAARGLVALEESDGEIVDSDKSWRNTWAFIQTFFRLAQQRIATITAERGDRHTRKRIARMKGKPGHVDGVQVVTLRRPKRAAAEDHVPHNVDWQKQWVVDGHWRQQHYRSLGPAYLEDGTWNPESHRQRWIAPYVKGPEGADLVLPGGRVYEFTR